MFSVSGLRVPDSELPAAAAAAPWPPESASSWGSCGSPLAPRGTPSPGGPPPSSGRPAPSEASPASRPVDDEVVTGAGAVEAGATRGGGSDTDG